METLSVVGLGGSAGSIREFQMFFSKMPENSGLAFVVVLHLSPDYESNLAELLQKWTSMPVVQVSEPLKVEGNRVYVIAPGKHLLMSDGQLIPGDMPREYGRRAAVDIFFRTLAETHRDRSVAIVFSGLDGDGAIGIKRIKENGGITVAQKPQEAQFDGMPRSAIETGMVDWVLPTSEMPQQLLEYQRNQNTIRIPEERWFGSSALEETNDQIALQAILTLLRTATAHDFSSYNRYTILRRIERRMRINSVAGLSDYRSFLRLHSVEVVALDQDLLVAVSNFFRDQGAFRTLAAGLGKLLADKKPDDAVRVWVPGCATGEEAYLIAILLSENAAKLNLLPSIQVFATDVDQRSIDQGRAGLYQDTITADVPKIDCDNSLSKN